MIEVVSCVLSPEMTLVQFRTVQVFSVHFSHDSALLLTASMDGSARPWTGAEVCRLQPQCARIADLQTGKDRLVITGRENQKNLKNLD